MRYITRDHLRSMSPHRSYRTGGQLRHVGFGAAEKESVIRSVGMGATGFALGVVHGRYAGMPEWKKIPLDFAVFAVAKVLRFVPGVPEKAHMALDIVGDGALTYFGGSIGVAVGQKWRAKAVGLTGAAPLNRAITQGASYQDARVQGRFNPEVLRQAVAGRR